MQKIALVTGASRGIGRAIAIELAARGRAVAVNYRTEGGKAEEVVEAIRSHGGRALAVQGDVGSPVEVQRMVEQVHRELGAVDILVNNAGVLARGDLSDFDYSQMEGMRRINVDAWSA